MSEAKRENGTETHLRVMTTVKAPDTCPGTSTGRIGHSIVLRTNMTPDCRGKSHSFELHTLSKRGWPGVGSKHTGSGLGFMM